MRPRLRSCVIRSWCGWVPIAQLPHSAQAIARAWRLQLTAGHDDLDATWETGIRLPSGHRVALVAHQHAPLPAVLLLATGPLGARRRRAAELRRLIAPSDVLWWAPGVVAPGAMRRGRRLGAGRGAPR